MCIRDSFLGALLYKSRLEDRANKRTERMGFEVYTTSQVIAGFSDAGYPPVACCRAVVARHDGVVAEELRQALSWIARGTAAHHALEDLAGQVDEESFSRLLRLMARATITGSDLSDQLRDLSTDHRNERRDHLLRLAAKRRASMMLPILLLMAPVFFLLVVMPLILSVL